MEADKQMLEKNWEDLASRLSVVFTRKAVVDECFIRKSANICKSIIGIVASQLNGYLMCQPMPIGLYSPRDIDSGASQWIYTSQKQDP